MRYIKIFVSLSIPISVSFWIRYTKYLYTLDILLLIHAHSPHSHNHQLTHSITSEITGHTSLEFLMETKARYAVNT